MGSQADFDLNLTSTAINIGPTSRIIVTFPSTYAPNLTSMAGGLYCSMNGLFLACKVETPYTIVLKNLPLVVPANTSFMIRVYGIS